MEHELRRALIGYRRRPTQTLFDLLVAEADRLREERESELEELSRQLDGALAALRETEALIAAEQEREQVILARLEELARRGRDAVSATESAIAGEAAAMLARLAQREMMLAKRRRQLYGLRDDVEDAVARVVRELEGLAPEPAPAEVAAEAGATGSAEPEEDLTREKAGA